MKICQLTPCLMTENNRALNLKRLKIQLNYSVDKIIINDQCFGQDDYLEDSKLHYLRLNTGPAGFVNMRNQLLEWFYNSDFDYAILLDSNDMISSPTLNDLETILESIRNDEDIPDIIKPTHGIVCDSNRSKIHRQPDYFDYVYLLPCVNRNRYSLGIHGLIIRNFKKYYGEEFYVSEKCNPKLGIYEDQYFAQLLMRHFTLYFAPTLVMNFHQNKFSTWLSEFGYKYPKIDYCSINNILLHTDTSDIKNFKVDVYKFNRIEKYKHLLRDYCPRKKAKKTVNIGPLFL